MGTSPGPDSLKANQYYANVDNIFWDIVFRSLPPIIECDELVMDLNISYDDKIARLTSNGIGLWDVYDKCKRPTASDKDIFDEVLNDFGAVFTKFPNVKRILFNGGTAYKEFQRNAKVWYSALFCHEMQSTSGQNRTNAFYTFKQWKGMFLDKSSI